MARRAKRSHRRGAVSTGSAAMLVGCGFAPLWAMGWFATSIVVGTEGPEAFDLAAGVRTMLLLGCYGVLIGGIASLVLLRRAAQREGGFRPVSMAAAVTVGCLIAWVAGFSRI